MKDPKSSAVKTPAWQRDLAEGIREPEVLLDVVGLDASWLPAARSAAHLFPLRVPHAYVRRMRHGESDDPLLRQVLPLAQEHDQVDSYTVDPVGDQEALGAPGVLHKYHGRVLVITTGACAIHCRFCFRRHFPYGERHAGHNDWSGLLEHLAAHPEVNEVLLSGGDPLMLSDVRLASLAARIAATGQVDRLRLHTRLPVVLPSRVNEELLEWLGSSSMQPVMVLHANHANELDHAVKAACERLKSAGVTLLNQSVLLRGVNDSTEALTTLSERLMECGVLPYYLHLLDRVQGAAHFSVDDSVAKYLYRKLQTCLPGYLVPRLVREQAGAGSKVLICCDG